MQFWFAEIFKRNNKFFAIDRTFIRIETSFIQRHIVLITKIDIMSGIKQICIAM